MALCEYCANYCYDEDSEEYYCDVDLDEDEYRRFLSNSDDTCHYFRNGDEYEVVKHQN